MDNKFDVNMTSGIAFCNPDKTINKLEKIKHKHRKFSNVKDYVNHLVRHIKDKVIRKFPNLQLVEIYIKLFDGDNIIDKIIISISQIISKLLELGKIPLEKSISICVSYDGKIQFIGLIDFTACLYT